jgi:hypothetical protein
VNKGKTFPWKIQKTFKDKYVKFHVENRKSFRYILKMCTSLQVRFSDEATAQKIDEKHQFVRHRPGDDQF